MNFAQTIAVKTDHPEVLEELLVTWDQMQAAADIMGYMESQLLADRERPGWYLIIAYFAETGEPGVSAYDEARKNDGRSETQEWDRRLREVIDGEPEYREYDEHYRTGPRS